MPQNRTNSFEFFSHFKIDLELKLEIPQFFMFENQKIPNFSNIILKIHMVLSSNSILMYNGGG